MIRRRGVVGRVPAFQPGLGSIPGGVRNFNFCSGIGCMSFVLCPVLSSAEAPDHTFRKACPCDICLVFWFIVCAPLLAYEPRAFGLYVPGDIIPTLGEYKY